MAISHWWCVRGRSLVGPALGALIAFCCIGMIYGGRAASARQVQSIDLVCFIAIQYNFTPALNYNTVKASGLGLLSACGSPNGRYPTLKSGTVFNTNDVTATGCWPLPLRMTGGNSEIVWNDGTKSFFTADITTDPRARGLRLNAIVTKGPLSGSHASALPTLVAQHGVCGLTGVRSASASFGLMPIYHWEVAKNTTARSTHASRR